MKLMFDEERAVQLFTILQDAWTKQEGVFKGIVLPQDRWPIPDDPVEAANYFAYAAITQRGGVVSEDPFKWVNHMRVTHPEFFDPQEVATRISVQDIMDVIWKTVTDRKSWNAQGEQLPFTFMKRRKKSSKLEAPTAGDTNSGIYKLDEFADAWHNNSVTLHQRWEGNVLNCFSGVGEFEEAYARIDHKNRINKGQRILVGIRRKIFSLLTIWLQEKILIPVFPTPFPVDRHANRILFGCEVVVPLEMIPFVVNPKIHPVHLSGRQVVRVTEKVTDQIALWSQPFMNKHGFSHLAINPALWVLSRELCRAEFQNSSTGRGRTGSRKSFKLVYPEALLANPQLWPFPYSDPSCVCPAASLCRKSFPDAPYGAFGMMVLSERLQYPHPRLFDGTHRGRYPARRNERK